MLEATLNGPLKIRLPASDWSAASTAPRKQRRHGRYHQPFSRRYGVAAAITRLVRNLPLATLTLKDFKDFADHEGLALIGLHEQ